MKLDSRRPGFVLPVALLLVVVVTGGVFATFSQLSTERRVRSSDEVGDQAYLFAETGLELATTKSDWKQDVADWHEDLHDGPVPPSVEDVDSLVIRASLESLGISGDDRDSVDVRIYLVRPADSDNDTPALYAIRSTGVWNRPDWPDAPKARRTVARLAEWVDGNLDVQAGWQSITGLVKQGTPGELSGVDQCGKKPTVAGVAVPVNPGYTQNGNANKLAAIGDPPVLPTGANPQEAAENIGIDWDAIVNGGAITPDVIYPDDGWPASTDDWPVIYVDNDPDETFTLPNKSGKGLLVVRGNLAFNGNETWDGVIMVGGTITSNGATRVNGATITGLNVQLGENVGVSDVGNGVKFFRYNSCNVTRAMQGMSGFNVLENTWTDTWATY